MSLAGMDLSSRNLTFAHGLEVSSNQHLCEIVRFLTKNTSTYFRIGVWEGEESRCQMRHREE